MAQQIPLLPYSPVLCYHKKIFFPAFCLVLTCIIFYTLKLCGFAHLCYCQFIAVWERQKYTLDRYPQGVKATKKANYCPGVVEAIRWRLNLSSPLPQTEKIKAHESRTHHPQAALGPQHRSTWCSFGFSRQTFCQHQLSFWLVNWHLASALPWIRMKNDELDQS